MIENLPHWINIVFIVTTTATIGLFYYSNSRPTKITLLIIVWAIIQSVLAYIGFYENTTDIPPRFGLVMIPTIVVIIYSLLPNQRAWIFKNRETSKSTFLHTVRLPVEIVLHLLFLNAAVPELMTYAGRNFDILAGITAPIIGLLYIKNKLSKKLLLLWNVIGLIMVSFILINGLLSAPLPFQQFGFEQPNIAVIYFPFILLPAVVVPIVIWTHLTDILKLSKEIKAEV